MKNTIATVRDTKARSEKETYLNMEELWCTIFDKREHRLSTAKLVTTLLQTLTTRIRAGYACFVYRNLAHQG